VATPAGLTLLKLIAWTDRSVDLRRKDAVDLGYLLSTYEQIPDIREALYEDENTGAMEGYDWDLSLAAAHLLGRHTRAIAQSDTQQRIARLADGELDTLNLDRLSDLWRCKLLIIMNNCGIIILLLDDWGTKMAIVTTLFSGSGKKISFFPCG
jgi:hypothetical protein